MSNVKSSQFEEKLESGRGYPHGLFKRMFWYAVLLGPAVGALILAPLLIGWGVYESRYGEPHVQPFAFLTAFMLFFLFLPVGFSPAAISVYFCKRTLLTDGALTGSSVFWGSLKGSMVGATLIACLMTLAYQTGISPVNFNGILALTICTIVLGPVCALILWKFRPRSRLGPLAIQELSKWRKQIGGEMRDE